MTIPTLMTNFSKHRVETKVVKFYSVMNQALRMSVADNDSPEGWITSGKSYSYSQIVEFLQTYIFPYLKVSNYNQCNAGSDTNAVCITNIDGTFWSIVIDKNGGDIFYYIDGDNTNRSPKNSFIFQFSKVSSTSDTTINSQNYIEPYIYDWDGTSEGLKNANRGCYKGCTACHYCTKLIQLNSWKIPSDYPWNN